MRTSNPGEGSEQIRDVDLPVAGISLWKHSLKAPRLTMAEIIHVVSEAYKVSVDELKGKGTNTHICVPRHHAMWLMKKQSHLSFPMIGKFLGGRDHTTIINGVRRHEERLAYLREARQAA